MEKWRSPLRYPGGKIKMAPFLRQLLKDNPKIKNYIEPFAGGAGIAINLLLNNLIDHITLNDYDIAIFCFWKSLVENNKEFMELFENTPITISEWHNQRFIFQNLEKRNIKNLSTSEIIKLGFSTFYMNRTNFSGILRGATPVGGLKQTGKWKLDCEFNKERLRPLLIKIGQKAENITISNLDMVNSLSSLNKGNSNYTDTESLMFIDPPYIKQGKRLYLPIKTMEDHKKIALQIKNLSCHWLLTYDAVNELMDYYNFANNKFIYSLQYKVKTHRQATEFLVISNNLKYNFRNTLKVIRD